ncbi:hypothetical protein [uncultured Jatrophihabitans sp.]|uniref:hypothetical protein n=1 Tax=uncultured Jatrophihabitans sp. TaxID=1610747 RepID=UPI0035CB1AB8
MSILPDPAELTAIADRIARHADATRARAERLRRAVAATHWHGLAATAFAATAAGVLFGLRTSAARLDDAADVLRAHAARVARVLAELAKTVSDAGRLADDLGAGGADLATAPGRLPGDVAGVFGDGLNLVGDGARLIGDGLHLIGIG